MATNEPMRLNILVDALLDHWRRRRKDAFLLEDAVCDQLDIVVKLAQGRAAKVLPARISVGVRSEELKSAAAYALAQTLFRDGASHYQTLGLVPTATAEAVRTNYRLLMQVVHPDRRSDSVALPDSTAARVNQAYAVLRDPDARKAYDGANRGPRVEPPSPPPTVSTCFSIQPRRREPRRMPAPILPEWLSAGVGGFARENPALTIFAGLSIVSVTFIAVIFVLEHEGKLTRDDSGSVGMTLMGLKPNPLPQPESVPETVQAAASVPIDLAKAPPRGLETHPVPRTRQILVVPSERSNLSNPARSPFVSNRSADSGPVAGGPIDRDAATMISSAERSAGSDKPTVAPMSAVVTAAISPITELTAQATTPDPPPVPSRAVQRGTTNDGLTATSASAPTSTDVESVIAAFVSYYEQGRVDALAALFDADARTNYYSGRAAIYSDYNELFQRSDWRKITINRLLWHNIGDRTEAVGEMKTRTRWRDGREAEQRIAVEMDFIRRGDKTLISRLSQRIYQP